MKKFRANYGTKIEEIEVVKETEKTISYMRPGHKSVCMDYKVSKWQSWHNSKEDAINYLISLKQADIDSNLKQIEYLKCEIMRIKML